MATCSGTGRRGATAGAGIGRTVSVMLATRNHRVMTAIGITALASIRTDAGIPAIASQRGMARLRSEPMLAVAAKRAAAKALNMTSVPYEAPSRYRLMSGEGAGALANTRAAGTPA